MGESAVARIQERPMESIIELPSQANLVEENVKNTTIIDSVNTIQRQENASTQRNSSQYKITENIVQERHLVFIRSRVVDKGARARGRGRGRGRGAKRQGVREEDRRFRTAVSR